MPIWWPTARSSSRTSRCRSTVTTGRGPRSRRACPRIVLAAGHDGGLSCCLLLHQGVLQTDLTEDLKKIDVPTLILHGDDDQIVPIGASAMLSSKIVRNATLKIYKGGGTRYADAEGRGERGPARVHQRLGSDGGQISRDT